MNLKSKLTAVGAAAAATALVAAPAFAAGPYTVTAGSTSSGTVAFTAATTTNVQFNTSSGLNLTCDAGTAGGTLNLGSNATGVGIASISSSTFSNCVGPLGIPLGVTQTASWRLNATGPAGTVTDGSIDQVAAHVSNPDGQCDFDVTGAVAGNFNSGNQSLNVTGGQTLNISNVSGCFALINEGDTAEFIASYAVSNPDGPITIS